MESSKCCIINCGVGGWYPQGVKRLEISLIYSGWGGEMFLWKDEYPPNSPTHQENQYAHKIYAFRYAIAKGFTKILWCDASFWAVKNPMPIFDFINDNGFYAFHTGYRLSQTCNDRIMAYSKLSHDDVREFPEHASGCVGFNLDNPNSKKVFDYWAELCDNGMFKGSRLHDNQSKDKDYLFFRQDQTALNISLYKNGVINKKNLDWVQYNPPTNDNSIFLINGM